MSELLDRRANPRTGPATPAFGGADTSRRSVLDRAHRGDVVGALGTIAVGDTGPRGTGRRRLVALLAVMGPGLVVLAADNDAGSLSTFAQAGQDYGLRLAWVLVPLAAALLVIQEMVARLGVVTGAGHARLIVERFGSRWGGFALADLVVLGLLTVMTEFVGVEMGMGYLGVSRWVAVPVGAAALLAVTALGSFRSWERSMLVLVGAGLIAVPLAGVVAGHHPVTSVVLAPRAGVTGTGVLFAVGMVGTTLAPWQLFFQQSSVVDKRITTRWLTYERIDTALGTVIFTLCALATLLACALALHAGPLHGRYTDGGGVARALGARIGPWAGDLFAVVLVDGSLLGAGAVALASAYAVGDARGHRHSLHRRWRSARPFYGTYAATIVAGAAAVLVSGDHAAGTLTLVVQALSGVLFPSAAVLLLLLANDREVLGPHVNPWWLNVVAVSMTASLLLLTAVLDLTTAFPVLGPHAEAVGGALAGAAATGAGAAFAGRALTARRRGRAGRVGANLAPGPDRAAGADRSTWSMPPIHALGPAASSRARTLGLAALRIYLLLTVVSVLVRLARG